MSIRPSRTTERPGVYARYGPLAALQRAIKRLANRLLYYERLDIMVLGREHLKAFKPRREISVTARLATESELRALQSDGKWLITESRMRKLKEGDSCLLSFVNDALAGYAWIHSQGKAEISPHLRLSIPEKLLYNYAGFTHPHYRGLGLQAFRHQSILAQDRWRRFEGILGYVSHTNFASRRGQAKSGYRCVGVIRMLGWNDRRCFVHLSKGLRRMGVRRYSPASSV